MPGPLSWATRQSEVLSLTHQGKEKKHENKISYKAIGRYPTLAGWFDLGADPNHVLNRVLRWKKKKTQTSEVFFCFLVVDRFL